MTEVKPEENSSLISKTFLWWILDIFKNGGFKENPLHLIAHSHDSEILGNKLETIWKEEVFKAKKLNRKPDLFHAVLKIFKKSYILWASVAVVEALLIRTMIPFTLAGFLAYYNPNKYASSADTHINAFLMLMLTLLLVFSLNHTKHRFFIIGSKISTACSLLIYRKILNSRKNTKLKTSSKQIMELLSNEVGKLECLPLLTHNIFMIPLQILLVAFLMWRNIWSSLFAGIAVIISQMIVTQGLLIGHASKLHGQMLSKRNNRLKLMSEIINGIFTIKLHAWESPFENNIKTLFNSEIRLSGKINMVQTLVYHLIFYADRLSLYAILLVYLLIGGSLQGDIVYPTMLYCSLLQTSLMVLLTAMSKLGKAMESFRKIEEFLNYEENPISALTNIQTYKQSKMVEIILKNVSVGRPLAPSIDVLHNINLEISKGNFYLVIGSSSCDKSALLELIIGELSPTKGDIIMDELQISYSTKEPCLFNGTIRENILFGEDYNEERYNKVMECCALAKDVNQFPLSNGTLMEQNVANLTRCQKAKISLARAVYKKADVYILDEPLALMNYETHNFIMQHCLEGFLSGCTRIVATRQNCYSKNAHIIVLNEGQIKIQGRFEEISSNHMLPDLKNIVHKDARSLNDIAPKQFMEDSFSNNYESLLSENHDVSYEKQNLLLSVKEPRPQSVFITYLKVGNSCLNLTVLFTMFITSQFFIAGSEIWLAIWTNEEEIRNFNQLLAINLLEGIDTTVANMSRTVNNIDTPTRTTTTPISILGTYLKTATAIENITDTNFKDEPIFSSNMGVVIWTILNFLSIIFLVIRNLYLIKIHERSSIDLHNNVLEKVTRAEMIFFKTNLSESILEWFGKYMSIIVDYVPRTFLKDMQIVLTVISTVVLSAIVNPYLLTIFFIIGFLYYLLSKVYWNAIKNIKRTEEMALNSIFLHITSTLNGHVIIRSRKAYEMVTEQFEKCQDAHMSARYLSISTSAAFGLWTGILCWINLCAVVYALHLVSYDVVCSGYIGLVTTQALVLLITLQQNNKEINDLLTVKGSLEKVLQCNYLPHETDHDDLSESKLPEDWPTRGKIVFHNVSIRDTKDVDPVLKNINITVESGWKVGIVDFHQPENSPFISALFRTSLSSGDILFDDENTKTIELKKLRTKISFIPRVPKLFTSTLRFNLDPFGQYSDALIWKALDNVKIKDSIASLSQAVIDEGRGFNTGQRQLLYLAKAILDQNIVIVLEETTVPNTDTTTEHAIQNILRNQFAHCTIFVISQRLHTIAGFDKIIVLNGGVIVQYAHPHILLKDNEGPFANLVKQLGTAKDQEIRDIAKIAYDSHIKFADEDN